MSAALDTIADHPIPGTPPVAALKVLRDASKKSWTCEGRKVRKHRIRRGEPRHGAKRSDDHIGQYVVEAPVAEISDDAVEGDTCPNCGGDRAVYQYRAYHYISGSEHIECTTCQETLHSEEWS